MLVLMITQSFYDFDARILRQTAALTKNNFKVVIICLNSGEKLKYEKFEGVDVHRIMRKFPQEKVIQYIFFSIIFLFKSLFKALELLIRNKPDVIQIHNMPDYLVFSALIHKLAGIPVVLDIHDLTVELFKEKWGDKKFRILKPFLIGIEKLSVKFSNKVITVSDQCGERLIERGLPKGKLTIVMNVADSKTFPYYKERSFKKIEYNLKLFYHGTIAERCGLHNTIFALPAVVERIPGTVFYIIGKSDNEYGNYLKNIAFELGIKDNISFNPPVPYEKVGEQFKTADLGIITESILEYSNFGIPTKAFEYAATGLPLLINELQVNRSIFKEESVSFIQYDNKRQIASEIIDLCLHPERRKRMSENAYADVMKVSDQIMQKRYLNLIMLLGTNHKNSSQ